MVNYVEDINKTDIWFSYSFLVYYIFGDLNTFPFLFIIYKNFWFMYSIKKIEIKLNHVFINANKQYRQTDRHRWLR